MKITLNCSKADFVRMVKESPTFSELFEIESIDKSALDSLLIHLKGFGNKIEQIKHLRGIKDTEVLRQIEVYCDSNKIHYDRYNEMISLATAKNFVEHFVK